MKRLVPKEWWDSWYEQSRTCSKPRAPRKTFTTTRLGKYFCHYSDYLLWDVMLKKYLPRTKSARVLEVGSAPGDFLVRLHKKYGFIPYGVEHSEPGVVQNRKLFSLYNIDPDNVIHADFFDDKFHRRFRQYFDIVVSRGFIEHFTDVEGVIDKHLNLLADGGYLIVSIPNLSRRSIYGACSSLSDSERLDMHNLDIMSKQTFSELFDRRGLSALYCDYCGTLRLSLLASSDKFLLRLALSACHRLQVLLNPIFRLVLRDKGFESMRFSPFLLYIGLKTVEGDRV